MTSSMASLILLPSDITESPSWTTSAKYAREKTIRKTGNQIQKERALFGSKSLKRAWENSYIYGGARWSTLPETIYDLYEDDAIEIEEQDLGYLLLLAISASHYSERADAATRLLGMLIEEGVTKRHPKIHDRIVKSLSILVDHSDASRRYNAIMALWQGVVIEAIKTISQRLREESNSVVKETADQAIKVLKHYEASEQA